MSRKTVYFDIYHKPFALCLAQHFRFAGAGPTIGSLKIKVTRDVASDAAANRIFNDTAREFSFSELMVDQK